MLEKLAAKGTPGVQYGKVDVDKAGALAQKYGVRGIPDTRIFYKGKQIDQFVGFRPSGQIESLVKKNLAKAQPQASSMKRTPPKSVDGYAPGIQPIPAS